MRETGKWSESGSLSEFGNGRLWSFEDCGGLKIGTLSGSFDFLKIGECGSLEECGSLVDCRNWESQKSGILWESRVCKILGVWNIM